MQFLLLLLDVYSDRTVYSLEYYRVQSGKASLAKSFESRQRPPAKSFESRERPPAKSFESHERPPVKSCTMQYNSRGKLLSRSRLRVARGSYTITVYIRLIAALE